MKTQFHSNNSNRPINSLVYEKQAVEFVGIKKGGKVRGEREKKKSILPLRRGEETQMNLPLRGFDVFKATGGE